MVANEQQEGGGCSSQLDAAVLDSMLAGGATQEELKASLHDVWQGHKEDPHKVHLPKHNHISFHH